MTNYTKATNFATKDALSSGNPLKIVMVRISCFINIEIELIFERLDHLFNLIGSLNNRIAWEMANCNCAIITLWPWINKRKVRGNISEIFVVQQKFTLIRKYPLPPEQAIIKFFIISVPGAGMVND